MKKRVSILIIGLILIGCALVSCSVDGDADGKVNPDIINDGIYGAGITTYIIREKRHTDTEYIELLNTLKNEIEARGGSALITDDGYAESGHEIVLGSTSRAISKNAAAALDKAIIKSVRSSENEEAAAEDTVGYTVYASASSVAVVWSDDSIKETAVRYFIDNFLSGEELELREGYAHSETFSYIAYLKEQDAKAREEEWAAVETALGAEACAALKKHYAMFDERFYLWLADLYDPETGGFYYSNSARDTVGYLPDLESTRQVMTFLDNSGMSSAAGGWNYAISDGMARSLTAFVKELQSSEDGYFYHPQWEGLTTSVSRLSRDADWAIVLLNGIYNRYKTELSAQGLSGEALDKALSEYLPYWNTPGGLAGSLGAPGSGAAPASKAGLTPKLGSSAVSLVSKAVSAASDASRWPEHLRSIASFKSYLDGMDIANDSYTVGNELVSQENQFLTRDSEAIAAGEVTKSSGYVATLKAFLNGAVNPQNGLWESAVSYNSINGLMKIGELYDAMGWEMLYPELAIESALKIAMTEGPDEKGYSFLHCCDVYNPWVAMQNIFKNVEKHASAEEKASFDEKWRAQMQKNAAEIISVTSKKTAEMSMTDGSYAFYSVESGITASTSQGMPVSVKNTVEGDVNGGIISCTGIINNMCSSLGIKAPAVFGSADMHVFYERIEALENIVKDEPVMLEYPLGFDEYEIGDTDFDGGEAVANEVSAIYICADPIASAENDKAILINTSPAITVNNKITFDVPSLSAAGANCYVFEFDMFMDNFGNSEGLQISMINKSAASFLSLNIDYYKASKALQIRARRDTMYGNDIVVGTVDAASWTKIRIEYFPATDKNTDTAVFYAGTDRELVGIVGDYMYDSPYFNEDSDSYGSAQIFCPRNTDYELYIDNVTVGAYRSAIPYIAPHDGRFDFDGIEIGKSSVKNALLEKSADGGISVADAPLSDVKGNNALFIDAVGTNRATFYKAENTPEGASCYVFEADYYIIPTATDYIQLNMKNSVGGIFCSTTLAYIKNKGELQIRSRSTSSMLQDTVIANLSAAEWVTLRIEYYPAERVAKFFSGEGYLGECAANYNNNSASSFLGVTVQSVSTSDYDLYLDNITVDEIKRVYYEGDTSIDRENDGIYDFEELEAGETEIKYTTVNKNGESNISVSQHPTQSDGKALLIDAVGESGITLSSSLIVPSGANCHVLCAELYFTPGVSSELSIFMNGADGEAFFAIELKYNADTSQLSIYSEGALLSELEAVSILNIRMEYYTVNGKVKLYIGDSLIGEISAAPGIGEFTSASVACAEGNTCQLYVDNIAAHSIAKTYIIDALGNIDDEPDAGNVTDSGWVK